VKLAERSRGSKPIFSPGKMRELPRATTNLRH